MKKLQVRPAVPGDSLFEPNREPLYKRLPRRDEDGNFLSDFMMLFPGQRNLSAALLQSRLALLHGLLDAHPDVVFADMNTPLNLLWVSVRARHGVISDVAAQIRQHLPEARLVGHTVLPGSDTSGPAATSRARSWLSRARARLENRRARQVVRQKSARVRGPARASGVANYGLRPIIFTLSKIFRIIPTNALPGDSQQRGAAGRNCQKKTPAKRRRQ